METSPVHTATAPLSRAMLPQPEMQYLDEASTSSAVTAEVQVCVEREELPVVSIQNIEGLPLGENKTENIFAIMNSEGIQSADDITNAADWKNITTKLQSRSKTSKTKFYLREYDANKHCGVVTAENPKPCNRSLTCKAHAFSLRRMVEGRSKPFDTLLAEHRASRDPGVAAAAAAAAAAAVVTAIDTTLYTRENIPGLCELLSRSCEEDVSVVGDGAPAIGIPPI